SEDALAIRRDRGRPYVVAPVAQLAFIHVHARVADRPSADELIALTGRHGTGYGAVDVAGARTGSAVNVGDVDVVDDDRVRHVHVTHVTRRVAQTRTLQLLWARE